MRPTTLPVDGGQGEAHVNAVLYANVVFLFAVPGWIANLLAAALRGAEKVRIPAFVTAIGSVITLALSHSRSIVEPNSRGPSMNANRGSIFGANQQHGLRDDAQTR